jgi:hypothetical protein
LGIQSLLDEDLPILGTGSLHNWKQLKRSFALTFIFMLGRDHTAADAIHAIESAKRIFGDEGFTFDMIFGRPGNTLNGWSKELKVRERKEVFVNDTMS